VVGLFVLGAAVIFLFSRSPYKFDLAPADAMWGKPDRPVNAVILHGSLITPTEMSADVVFARDVMGNALDTFASQLGMTQKPRAEAFYPAQNLSEQPTSGNAIFSRFPLYESRSIPNKGGSFGVWAVAVVDGKKFMLASIVLSDQKDKELAMLKKAWIELGSPPMIIGGDFADGQSPRIDYWGW